MDRDIKKTCTVSPSNKFWLYYLSLEKSLIEINDYLSINHDNFKSYSYKIMQLFFAVCSDIDSLFKYIHFNLYKQELSRSFCSYDYQFLENSTDNSNAVVFFINELNSNIGKYLTFKGLENFNKAKIYDNMKMLKETFPLIRNVILVTDINGDKLELKPFEILFYFYELNYVKKEFRTKFSEDIKKEYGTDRSWWEQYNSLKHQRVDNYHLANLKNLLNSLAALHILNLLYVITLDKDADYLSTAVEVSTAHHFPILRIKNSGTLRYVGGGGDYYATYLNNKPFYEYYYKEK